MSRFLYLNREIIEDLLDSLDLFSLILKGFISYSNRQAVVPQLGNFQLKILQGMCILSLVT